MLQTPELTREQQAAAYESAGLVLVEACAGAGKTTVLVERFGYLRYSAARSPLGVLIAGYTATSVKEVSARIRGRFGPAALAWPSHCGTIDELFRHLLQVCCGAGLLGAELHTTNQPTTVHDSWQGLPRAFRDDGSSQRRYQKATIGRYRLSEPALRLDTVRSPDSFDVRQKRQTLLAGDWTHREVRDVVLSAITRPAIRQALIDYLAGRFMHFLFDECFDGNRDDLALATLMADAGIPMTFVGDEWQAVFEFRDSAPSEVRSWLDEHRRNIVERPLKESHRHTGEVLRRCQGLRGAGSPLTDPPQVHRGDVRLADPALDVVLGRHWLDLRQAGVLPLQLGSPRSCPGAVLEIAYRQLLGREGEPAPIGHLLARIARHGVEVETVPDLSDLLLVEHASYEAFLSASADRLATSSFPCKDFDRSWNSIRQLLGPGSADFERYLSESLAFAQTVAMDDERPTLVRGMTVHGAKGSEWDAVALVATLPFAHPLRTGVALNVDEDEDRLLYVASSRARKSFVLLAPR